ncbi:uncharacterized protein ARMOST_02349 [Armillaria ostoyae]|uniref:Uncharacterized protein n=1 Tax=Armillaria ostoyae TaxID=47428 RepID=A0A284QRF0_ARMOS|nr:uncharacterized protein ARMOST_02349 [Armillaria ostoyae]
MAHIPPPRYDTLPATASNSLTASPFGAPGSSILVPGIMDIAPIVVVTQKGKIPYNFEAFLVRLLQESGYMSRGLQYHLGQAVIIPHRYLVDISPFLHSIEVSEPLNVSESGSSVALYFFWVLVFAFVWAIVFALLHDLGLGLYNISLLVFDSAKSICSVFGLLDDDAFFYWLVFV